jgi:ketosteroid isomerase-like protein
MSQENVEIVRRSIELWSDGNWEALRAVYDPYLVILPPDGWPDGEVRVGLEAWIEQSMILKEPWETDSVTPDEFYEAGDSVVAHLHWISTGKGSGIAVEREFWVAYTLVAGKIIRIAFFADRRQALEAVGLPELDGTAHVDRS